ncbi:hypothetical protein [Vibrio splendidus]|nr:hypothetical protein [Vibrio splendidus]
MTVKELENALEEIDIGYYESGAYYDSSRETWDEKHIRSLEEEYRLTVIE